MSSSAVRKLAPRAQQTGVSNDDIEGFIAFARHIKRPGKAPRIRPGSELSQTMRHDVEVYSAHYPPDAANHWLRERQAMNLIDLTIQPFDRKLIYNITQEPVNCKGNRNSQNQFAVENE